MDEGIIMKALGRDHDQKGSLKSSCVGALHVSSWISSAERGEKSWRCHSYVYPAK